MDDEEVLLFETQHEWERWLGENHELTHGVRLKIAKKGSGTSSVSYLEAVESALCYGWIDGIAKRLDESYYLQRFTARRSRSAWSRINRERAEKLRAAGRIREPGLREIERAKADGRWDAAYDSPATATVPDDLAAAFAERPKAKSFFEQLDGTNRYAVLHRIALPAKPETRAKRIARFVEMLENGRKIYE